MSAEIWFEPGLVPVLKHGSHNQKTHAGRSDGSDAAATAQSRATLGGKVDASVLGADGMGYVGKNGERHTLEQVNETGLARLVTAQKWNQPAQQVDQDTFDRLAQRDDFVTVWRGGPSGLEKGMIEGTPFVGNGVLGPGTYVTTQRSRAENFATEKLVPILAPRSLIDGAPSASRTYLREPIIDHGLNGSGAVRNADRANDYVVWNTGALIVGPPIAMGAVGKETGWGEVGPFYMLGEDSAIEIMPDEMIRKSSPTPVQSGLTPVLKHGSHNQQSHAGRRASSTADLLERYTSDHRAMVEAGLKPSKLVARLGGAVGDFQRRTENLLERRGLKRRRGPKTYTREEAEALRRQYAEKYGPRTRMTFRGGSDLRPASLRDQAGDWRD